MSRVLVVDDKEENVYYLQALLAATGYQVETARHGAEALVRARNTTPDLVISDLLMPVMDGYTLLRHWKSDPRLSRVPFVVYTATYTEPEDERLALALGADAFILKPAEPDDFLGRLRAVEAGARDGAPTRVPRALEDEPDLLKVYSQTLVRKLEEKTLQLEEANRTLQAEIAERRELARHLEAERARLAEAQAVANMGSWETDLATGATSWSEETHRIFETDPAAFRPTHAAFLAMVHPEDPATVDGAFVASLATETDHALDHRICLEGGRLKHVQERWRVFRDAGGTPVRAAGTCLDITARKRSEEAIRESEERFRQLAETIAEVFWMSNPAKTQMLYVSPAYEAIWGRTCAELYEHPESWLDGVHPEDREAVRQALPAQTRGDYETTYRVVRPDGGVRWVRDRAFPVRDAAGAVYRIVGIAEDITERRAIESQFLRAQRMESIGTLAGGIAHDLNNVLTPILMAIDLLRGAEAPEERAESIATIEASARKGADMVRQVLSFARGIEGRRVEVDVARLIRDVEKIVNDTFLKAIHLRTSVARDLPAVLGDPTQLHQVLLNLCVNARDAMPGGGTITITARPREVDADDTAAPPDLPHGPYVAISVADAGTGMAPAVLERIFEPFYTTKEQGKGTGLGLSTSLAIVRSHGGFFDVRSTAGEGSTFTVCLPAGGDPATVSGVHAAVEVPRGSGETVLVVDDEPLIREVTRRTLEACGYRVILAAEGAEAIAQFRKHPGQVALVLTDMMMPVMDGAATIRALRAIDPAVPVVAVSGLAHDTDDGSEGPTSYLQKPYTTEELLRTIDAALREPS